MAPLVHDGTALLVGRAQEVVAALADDILLRGPEEQGRGRVDALDDPGPPVDDDQSHGQVLHEGTLQRFVLPQGFTHDLLLRDVLLEGDEMRDVPCASDGRYGHVFPEQLAVLALVVQLPLPGPAGENGPPQVFVDLGRHEPRFHDPWVLADDFGEAETRFLLELRVDVFDDPVDVRDHDAHGPLLHHGGQFPAPLLALAQGALRSLAFADVMESRDGAGMDSVLDHGTACNLDVQQIPGPSPEAVFRVVGLAPLQGRLEGAAPAIKMGVPLMAMEDVVADAPDDLLGRVA
ncbi:hypothetical protein DSECCO2_622470 [anaerobic digester metagenome]